MAIYNGGLSIIDLRQTIADKTRSNLLRPTLKTTTKNGVTCTYNGDGTYTINGTALGRLGFIIGRVHIEKDKKYRIVGCPSGGSYEPEVGYKLYTSYDDTYAIDYGESQTFEPTRESISDVVIQVNTGTVCDNLLFKPMITYDLSATYDDFVSYNDSFIMGINSGINMDLLWEYANPNNGYSGGVPINLDLSGYKFIYITALTWAGNNSYVDYLFKIDNLVHTMLYFDMYGMKRELTIKTNGIDVGDNLFFQTYGIAGSANNAGLVPYRIYGVK